MQILQAKEVRYGAPLMRELERICLLKCVDRQWMDHIDNMDQLRQGIALRGYGQKDPVVEYRIEGFDMFDQMVDSIREDSVKMLLTIEIRQAGAAPKREQVAKPTGEGFVPGNGAPRRKGCPQGPARAGDQDRPQRSLPLRQRPEVEKVHLRQVPSGRPAHRRKRRLS